MMRKQCNNKWRNHLAEPTAELGQEISEGIKDTKQTYPHIKNGCTGIVYTEPEKGKLALIALYNNSYLRKTREKHENTKEAQRVHPRPRRSQN